MCDPESGQYVDTHVHVFPPKAEFDNPMHPHPEWGAGFDMVRDVSKPFGIKRFVLTQPSFLRFDNTVILERLREFPDILRGVIWVDEDMPPAELRELRSLGVVGLRFPFFFLKTEPSWDAYGDLFLEARANHMHIELGMYGKPLVDRATALIDLGLDVVVAHVGMFDTGLGPLNDPNFDALLELAASGKLWIKLSGPYLSSYEAATVAAGILLKKLGPRRLVWGSDWPHVSGVEYNPATYADVFGWLTSTVSDRGALTSILSDTPGALYHFDESLVSSG